MSFRAASETSSSPAANSPRNAFDTALPGPALKFLDTLRSNARSNCFRRSPRGIGVKILVHFEGKILRWVDDLAHHGVSRRDPRMCACIGDPRDEDQLLGPFAADGGDSLRWQSLASLRLASPHGSFMRPKDY